MSTTDYRVVGCEACGTEGQIYSDEYTSVPCPWCEGTGGEVIEVYPIEMKDL